MDLFHRCLVNTNPIRRWTGWGIKLVELPNIVQAGRIFDLTQETGITSVWQNCCVVHAYIMHFKSLCRGTITGHINDQTLVSLTGASGGWLYFSLASTLLSILFFCIVILFIFTPAVSGRYHFIFLSPSLKSFRLFFFPHHKKVIERNFDDKGLVLSFPLLSGWELPAPAAWRLKPHIHAVHICSLKNKCPTQCLLNHPHLF